MPTLPATILGYTFLDTSLLRQALTHPSFVNESRESGLTDYQRLEFLGECGPGPLLGRPSVPTSARVGRGRSFAVAFNPGGSAPLGRAGSPA